MDWTTVLESMRGLLGAGTWTKQKLLQTNKKGIENSYTRSKNRLSLRSRRLSAEAGSRRHSSRLCVTAQWNAVALPGVPVICFRTKNGAVHFSMKISIWTIFHWKSFDTSSCKFCIPKKHSHLWISASQMILVKWNVIVYFYKVIFECTCYKCLL